MISLTAMLRTDWKVGERAKEQTRGTSQEATAITCEREGGGWDQSGQWEWGEVDML